jgi:hypothetical protein
VGRLLGIVVLVALVAATAASAATPAQYRAHVNAICRGFTPKMKVQEAALKRAQTNKDAYAYGVALGKLLVLQLAEDKRIEATPVPAPLRTTMTPIIARLEKADVLIRKTLRDAAAGNSTAMVTDLKALLATGKPLNGMLDRAGLRDCGSNQS